MRTVLHMLLAIVNVLISIPLTKIYGEIGCALGTCVATFISSTLVSNYFYSKVIHLDIKAFFKEMFRFIPVVAIMLIIGLVINVLGDIHSWSQLMVYGLLFTVSYTLVMIRFAFNDYEKGLLKQVSARLQRG